MAAAGGYVEEDHADVGTWIGAVLWAFAVVGLVDLAADPPVDGGVLYGVGWAVVGFGVVLAVAYTVWTRFWRRWLRWLVPTDAPTTGPSTVKAMAGELVIMTSVLCVLFVAVGAMFVAHGWTEMRGDPGPDRVVESLAAYFGLMLLDSIPVLHLVDTFELSPPATFHGVANGVLVTGFRLLLIAPVVGLATAIARRVRPSRVAVTDPAGSSDPA